MNTTIKVVKMDDIEWWAGESLEGCLAAGRAMCGADCYPSDHELCEQRELTDEEMQRLQFVDEDGSQRSFADELARRVAAGESFPQPFAATDY